MMPPGCASRERPRNRRLECAPDAYEEPAVMNRSSAVSFALGLSLSLAGATLSQAQAPAQDPVALFARAVGLHQAGDLLGAIDAYRDFLKLRPDSPEVRSNLGAVLSRLGRYDEAIEKYRLALKAQGASAAYRFNLGLALYKSGRPEEAAVEFGQVLRMQPDNKAATLLLADCQLQLGLTHDVVQLLSPRETDFADDDAFACLLGTALIEENDLTADRRSSIACCARGRRKPTCSWPRRTSRPRISSMAARS
jgi:tetratricopeptide (TPR) repeat protein